MGQFASSLLLLALPSHSPITSAKGTLCVLGKYQEVRGYHEVGLGRPGPHSGSAVTLSKSFSSPGLCCHKLFCIRRLSCVISKGLFSSGSLWFLVKATLLLNFHTWEGKQSPQAQHPHFLTQSFNYHSCWCAGPGKGAQCDKVLPGLLIHFFLNWTRHGDEEATMVLFSLLQCFNPLHQGTQFWCPYAPSLKPYTHPSS